MFKLMVCALLCCRVSARAQEHFTPEQLLAHFYNDLGPATVDVSSYPKIQRDNYARFKETCSQCHTLARSINSPVVERAEWAQYVRRMHLISKEWPDTEVTEEDAKAILDFLVFDSQKRKVENKEEFEKQTEGLKALFEKVQEERLRLHSIETNPG